MIRHYYDEYDNAYFQNVIDNGVIIHTSGSAGDPKAIFQSPTKIQADAKFAAHIQNITKESVVYTCLNPQRAGGLFAQTIPALLVGATVDYNKFSPYEYVRVATKYTHTHLTPKQAKAVMLTKGFKKLDLTGKTFLIGSEPVTYDIIDAFIAIGAKVICIWGMTEIGVNAIMHVFNSVEDVTKLKTITPNESTVLGNVFNCNWNIRENDCLWVTGNICVYDDWFNTKDTVIFKDGYLFYTGRYGTPVDFNNPKKG
tara:strand:- start:4880 stop:5644 length:765 start_codon:yes stop_codon:yes gene_type:complete